MTQFWDDCMDRLVFDPMQGSIYTRSTGRYQLPADCMCIVFDGCVGVTQNYESHEHVYSAWDPILFQIDFALCLAMPICCTRGSMWGLLPGEGFSTSSAGGVPLLIPNPGLYPRLEVSHLPWLQAMAKSFNSTLHNSDTTHEGIYKNIEIINILAEICGPVLSQMTHMINFVECHQTCQGSR